MMMHVFGEYEMASTQRI